MISCSLGDDGVPSYEDTCSFTCNTGYVLNGSNTSTCQNDGSWGGDSAICSRGEWFLMCMPLVFHLSNIICEAFFDAVTV